MGLTPHPTYKNPQNVPTKKNNDPSGGRTIHVRPPLFVRGKFIVLFVGDAGPYNKFDCAPPAARPWVLTKHPRRGGVTPPEKYQI